MLVLTIVFLMILAFFIAIFWTWEAPVPTSRVEKILPETALTGGPIPFDGTGLLEPVPRYVGPITVPTRTDPNARPQTGTAASNGQTTQEPAVQSIFDEGPITIDTRDDG